MKNRLGAPNTCVSEVAARVQPVKAESWKGINPSEAATCSSEAHASEGRAQMSRRSEVRREAARLQRYKRQGSDPPESKRTAAKSVKRSARALWVVNRSSRHRRNESAAQADRHYLSLHTECRNGRHGGHPRVKAIVFCHYIMFSLGSFGILHMSISNRA